MAYRIHSHAKTKSRRRGSRHFRAVRSHASIAPVMLFAMGPKHNWIYKLSMNGTLHIEQFSTLFRPFCVNEPVAKKSQ